MYKEVHTLEAKQSVWLMLHTESPYDLEKEIEIENRTNVVNSVKVQQL